MSDTRIRRPRIHGRPPQTCGSIVMRSTRLSMSLPNSNPLLSKLPGPMHGAPESGTRRRCEIGPPTAGEQLAGRIQHLSLRGGELPAHADDFAANREIARHRRRVIIHPQVDRGYAAAQLLHHCPVGAEVDQGGKHAAMGVAALGIDDPFLTPSGFDLDPVILHRDNFEPKPLVIRPARDDLLHALQSHFLTHGVTTTLPITSRSRIMRSPSAACSNGNTLSISGLTLPS